ncbi:MAG: phage holin family protein [Desulfatibacillaceae bacterium]
MPGLLIRWIVMTVAILATAFIMDGIVVTGFLPALFAAALLGILNAFLRPILLLLTLPINILTLGLFTLVINAVLLMMVSGVIGGFMVHGFWTALFGALLIGLASWAMNTLVTGGGQVRVIEVRGDRRGPWQD